MLTVATPSVTRWVLKTMAWSSAHSIDGSATAPLASVWPATVVEVEAAARVVVGRAGSVVVTAVELVVGTDVVEVVSNDVVLDDVVTVVDGSGVPDPSSGWRWRPRARRRATRTRPPSTPRGQRRHGDEPISPARNGASHRCRTRVFEFCAKQMNDA